jgi:spore maturation protein CgeB
MRILILTHDYPGFLTSFHQQNPELETASYEEHLQARVDSLFGVADFYSRNLRALGHEARDLYINNEFMQSAWAREHSVPASTSIPTKRVKSVLDRMQRIRSSPVLRPLKPLLRPLAERLDGRRTLFEILAAQIRHYKPDVILSQAIQAIPDEFLREFKKDVPLMVGQIASPFSSDKQFRAYDLMISSLPNFVDRFRKQGMKAELVRLAFDAPINGKIPASTPSIDVSFVGTLSADHQDRLDFLETVASRLDLHVWGRVLSSLPAGSALRRCHHGDAFGREMYAILQKSRITLNFHIDVAEQYANNLRLYEATGVGTLLLTDYKQNLCDMFEPGKEVATYRTPEECVEKARYYLDHEKERTAMAGAGQQRTLHDHTYARRMEELSTLFERCLQAKP